MDFPKLHHPTVLIHGLGSRSYIGPVEYFFRIPNALRKSGNSVFVADLTAWSTVETRAKKLRLQVEGFLKENNLEDQKVNLIGHSMGGLDARYLTSALGFHERVASVTTIGTPNKGSMLANVLHQGLASSNIDWVAALPRLSTHYLEDFHEVVCPNVEGVQYFSATSAISKKMLREALPIFWMTSKIIKKFEGDNDGFVSVDSAKWGDHICTYSGDHYGQIGQIMGYTRGLNHYKFFHEILTHLRREGF